LYGWDQVRRDAETGRRELGGTPAAIDEYERRADFGVERTKRPSSREGGVFADLPEAVASEHTPALDDHGWSSARADRVPGAGRPRTIMAIA
jgi:hypothetical protein